MLRKDDLILHKLFRLLAEGGGDDSDTDDEHSGLGVHITYEDLYNTFIYLACVYICGQIASGMLRMPNLVGEIFCGILLGPPLADFVPNPQAFVLLGEVGYVVAAWFVAPQIDSRPP
jgi:hypothetical protein